MSLRTGRWIITRESIGERDNFEKKEMFYRLKHFKKWRNRLLRVTYKLQGWGIYNIEDLMG